MRSTRLSVRSSTPAASAFGQWVTAMSLSEPRGQPLWQAPQLLQARRPS